MLVLPLCQQPDPARAPVAVAASRALTADDNGLVLRCAPGITLTVPDAGALPAV